MLFYRLIDDVTDRVRADGQPREARAIDQDGAESRHMVFLDGDTVRSCLLDDWPAEQQALAQAEQARRAAAQLRQTIRDKLTSMAGVRVDDLTTPQLKALLGYLLWREGGIDAELKVKPIGEWGR